MRKQLRLLTLMVALALIGALLVPLLRGGTLAVLDPKGIVALKERSLMLEATLLMLLVVIPVFVMAFGFAWKYRAGNPKAAYEPDFDHNLLAESVWWGIPCLVIAVLAVLAWTGSHELDPYRPLQSAAKPITVQVVALQWKWLFIYPEQHVASVNLLEFPAGTPVNFEITADAPMNSFWIPQLGGQIYAMPGMTSQLHLMADSPGTFQGSSANLSGEGFADMRFTAKAISQQEFAAWVKSLQSGTPLDAGTYAALARPGTAVPNLAYSKPDPLLYDSVLMKFMSPSGSIQGMDMPGMVMP